MTVKSPVCVGLVRAVRRRVRLTSDAKCMPGRNDRCDRCVRCDASVQSAVPVLHRCDHREARGEAIRTSGLRSSAVEVASSGAVSAIGRPAVALPRTQRRDAGCVRHRARVGRAMASPTSGSSPGSVAASGSTPVDAAPPLGRGLAAGSIHVRSFSSRRKPSGGTVSRIEWSKPCDGVVLDDDAALIADVAAAVDRGVAVQNARDRRRPPARRSDSRSADWA